MTKCDEIIKTLQGIKKGDIKFTLNPQAWLDAGLSLQTFISEETDEMERLNRIVAEKKLEVLRKQEKKNVSLADLEVSVLPEYLSAKKQEHKVNQVKELVKLCKKNCDINHV